ncbi:hypothetical protein ANN_19199 [Periplaneta americana]|uniref:Uncharacterized protein n=1 Tax=Periplaneta americana TaxID=6978 RepID=A0ABQ8SA46_PERAM|nr:hypothetical protein ANN_19199 [Periplaneta americana]
MAGLCEGGSEPLSSLKAISLNMPNHEVCKILLEENDDAKHCDATLLTNDDQNLSDDDGEIDTIESLEDGDALSSYCASSIKSSSDDEDKNFDCCCPTHFQVMVTGIAHVVACLLADLELRLGIDSIPACADNLVGFILSPRSDDIQKIIQENTHQWRTPTLEIPLKLSIEKKIWSQEIRNAATLPKNNMVSQEKKKNVLNLMKYFRIPESAKDFYKDITGNSC